MTDQELEAKIKKHVDGYVERFARTNHITEEEARKWANVRIYEDYIRENPPREMDDPVVKEELDFINCDCGSC